MSRIAVHPSRVREMLESGHTKEEIRSTLYPGLNRAQWEKAVKTMGLNGVRPKKVDFFIVDEQADSNAGTIPSPTPEIPVRQSVELPAIPAEYDYQQR